MLIQQHSSFGMVNENGFVLSCCYKSITLWAQKYLKVEDFNSEYLVDETGKRISSNYRLIGKPENGKAKVVLDRRIGYIDETGQPIPEYEMQLSDGSIKYLLWESGVFVIQRAKQL